MNQEESLSLITHKPENVKSVIIQKLSKQWPLTIKQLDHALRREYGIEVTYQAVHKAIAQLDQEKVVQKEGKGYQLHEEWISNINQISKNIAENYSRNEPLVFDKEIIQMHFKNWISAGRFIAFDFKEQTPNPENKEVITCWMHVWPVNTVSIEETQRLVELSKKEKHYCVCPGNTALDSTIASFLEKMHKKNIIGAPIILDHDYAIKGDHIAQIYYDKSFYDKVNAFYNETKDIKKVDYPRMQQLVTEKTDVHVVIIKNAALANILRREALSYFKGNEPYVRKNRKALNIE